MFSIFKNSNSKKSAKKGSIRQLDKETRLLMNEYLNDEVKASDIADELELDVELVYRQQELTRRKRERESLKFGDKDLIRFEQQIEAEKKRYEWEQLKIKNDLDLEKKKLEVEELRLDLYGDNESDAPEDDLGIKDLISFLMTLKNKDSNIPNFQVGGGETTSQAEILKTPAALPPTNQDEKTSIDKSEEELKNIISQIPPVFQNRVLITEDKTIQKYMKKHYQLDLTIKDITRAKELIKNEALP